MKKTYPTYQYSLLPPAWRSQSPISLQLRRRAPLIPLLAGLTCLLTVCYLAGWFDLGFVGRREEGGCDPWMSWGRLEVNTEVPESNIWRPFPLLPSHPPAAASSNSSTSTSSGTCTPPPLMRALRESLDLRSPGLTPWPSHLARETLPFLQNRTVLLLGDSVTRNTVQQFCSLVSLSATQIHRGHAWDLVDEVPDEWVPGEYREREGWEGWRRENEDRSRPTVCYVPEWDFAVVSVFHWGMDETDYWRTKDQYNPPGPLEHRMQAIALPLLARLALPASEGGLAPHPRSPIPDLIELSSTLWDLAKFARDDLDSHQPTITDLTGERLEWWRSRLAASIRFARQLWPETELLWRSSHWPSDGSAKIDWFMGWSWDQPEVHRPFFHQNRLLQLDHAARSLFLPPPHSLTQPGAVKEWHRAQRELGVEGVKYSNWGNLLLGQHAHQHDQLHPGPLPAAWLWGDMILFQLRRALGYPESGDGELPASDA